MIRPARNDDARQIGELHARIWGTHGRSPDEEAELFAAHFRHVYLGNPWYDEECGPLVHEEADGRITGVLGIVRRPMRLGDRRLWMAVSSELAVDPATRSQLAAVRMIKRFLNGPQDISLADRANRQAQKLWLALGGTMSHALSLTWWRPLRPLTWSCSLFKRRRGLSPLAWVATPFARLGDRLADRLPGHPLRTGTSEATLLPLTPELLERSCGQAAADDALRPEHDAVFSNWVWKRLDEMFDRRRLHRQAVCSPRGELLGWFMFVMDQGTADIWDLAARRDAGATVLKQLWSHARRLGADVATGRNVPRLQADLADERCLFTARGPYVLTHSRDHTLNALINSGEALLSPLDGERPLSCQYDDESTPVVQHGNSRQCPLPCDSPSAVSDPRPQRPVPQRG